MKNKFQYFIIVLLMALSAYVAWKSYLTFYVAKDTVDIHKFPMEIDGWVAEDVPLTEREYEILETRNVFTRRYIKAPNKGVMLMIVYSQNNRKVSHPPEICYTGGGAGYLEKAKDAIVFKDGKRLDIQKFYLQQNAYHQAVLYWFKVGQTFTPSYWKQQVLIAWDYLIGKPSSSAMIRISGAGRSIEERNKVEEDMKEFAATITPELFKYLP